MELHERAKLISYDLLFCAVSRCYSHCEMEILHRQRRRGRRRRWSLTSFSLSLSLPPLFGIVDAPLLHKWNEVWLQSILFSKSFVTISNSKSEKVVACDGSLLIYIYFRYYYYWPYCHCDNDRHPATHRVCVCVCCVILQYYVFTSHICENYYLPCNWDYVSVKRYHPSPVAAPAPAIIIMIVLI